MPELVNKALGVTVSTSETVASTLGAQWGPAEKSEPKEAPKRRTRKSDDD